ncbi:MAG: hypothetical protein JW723_14995 [Bacteroidales bacterium]|nr:hypothetical protein [Bacteroidales bacterium]
MKKKIGLALGGGAVLGAAHIGVLKAVNELDISAISLSRFGLLSNEKLGKLIISHIGKKKIEDSDIPMAIIATDASNGNKVVLKRGPVADAGDINYPSGIEIARTAIN